MKIASTNLVMQAEHAAVSYRQSSETLRSWHGQRPDFEAVATHGLSSAITQISAAARDAQARFATRSDAPPVQTEAVTPAGEPTNNDPFLTMVRQMIEHLTGEKMHVFDVKAFSTAIRHVEANSSATREAVQSVANDQTGHGMEYDYHAVHEEYEATQFSADGVIRTTDGQEISFRLDLEMTRYYREETNVSARAGDAVRKDPLVVNFGGTAAQLTQQASQFFRFDLDGDGKKELIPLFASGSAFLALDLNHNGLIDSGKELFGPKSGSGFVDLKRLDNDGNGWIDEGDTAFDNLYVWTPAAEGDGDLRSLADVGIGALGLAHVASPLALRGCDNQDLGLIKSSGVYLTTSGKAGSLQEIDITT